jgi:hypothetical protein
MERVGPALVEQLVDQNIEVPDELRRPDEPRKKRWDCLTCRSCGWEGHEGQLEREWFPSGSWPSRCPVCHNGRLADDQHFARDGFVVVPA